MSVPPCKCRRITLPARMFNNNYRAGVYKITNGAAKRFDQPAAIRRKGGLFADFCPMDLRSIFVGSRERAPWSRRTRSSAPANTRPGRQVNLYRKIRILSFHLQNFI